MVISADQVPVTRIRPSGNPPDCYKENSLPPNDGVHCFLANIGRGTIPLLVAQRVDGIEAGRLLRWPIKQR
jgi:hypothetical protein